MSRMSGFGPAPIKREGKAVPVDAGAGKGGKPGKPGKPGICEDWMEMPIPKNASRARVHKMVDRWLDERARGFRGLL